MKIIPYEEKYLTSWLRCRLLASFQTFEQYNGLNPKKDSYPENKMIDLICVNEKDQVIGLQQTIVDTLENKQTLYKGRPDLGAYFMENYVHPDYQNQGIGKKLFLETCQQARNLGVKWLEIWTGPDEQANHFYQSFGAKKIYHYWQVEGFAKPPLKIKGHFNEEGFLSNVTHQGLHFPYIQEKTRYQVFQEKDLSSIEAKNVQEVTCYLLELT